MGKQFEASPESCRIFERELVSYLAGKAAFLLPLNSYQLEEKVPLEFLKDKNKWLEALRRLQ